MSYFYSPRFFSFFLALMLQSFLSYNGLAWEDHATITQFAFDSNEKLKGALRVPTESIDHFLAMEKAQLGELLETEELWAINNVSGYLPRPVTLRFRNSTDPKETRNSFLEAIRVNPNTKLALYLQQIPGVPTKAREPISEEEVTLIPGTLDPEVIRFAALKEMELVSPLNVLTTASDEPDYGMDIGLWEDSGTLAGSKYGFGKQPFGNPKVEFSSQSPFHMVFLHEPRLVYAFASYLNHDFVDYRIRLFQSLAQYAFAKRHPYWGWRFTGWALHYIQDLTQPYHSTPMPGMSIAKMLFMNALDLLGYHSWKDRAVQLVTNRHFALENYALHFLLNSIENRNTASNFVIQSLKGGNTVASLLPYDFMYLRNIVSAESHALALRTDSTLVSSLPRHLVSDPDYIFGDTDQEIDILKELSFSPKQAQESMENLLSELLFNTGKHSRNFVNSILESVQIN